GVLEETGAAADAQIYVDGATAFRHASSDRGKYASAVRRLLARFTVRQMAGSGHGPYLVLRINSPRRGRESTQYYAGSAPQHAYLFSRDSGHRDHCDASRRASQPAHHDAVADGWLHGAGRDGYSATGRGRSGFRQHLDVMAEHIAAIRVPEQRP